MPKSFLNILWGAQSKIFFFGLSLLHSCFFMEPPISNNKSRSTQQHVALFHTLISSSVSFLRKLLFAAAMLCNDDPCLKNHHDICYVVLCSRGGEWGIWVKPPLFFKGGKEFQIWGQFDSWDTSPKVKWLRCNVF